MGRSIPPICSPIQLPILGILLLSSVLPVGCVTSRSTPQPPRTKVYVNDQLISQTEMQSTGPDMDGPATRFPVQQAQHQSEPPLADGELPAPPPTTEHLPAPHGNFDENVAVFDLAELLATVANGNPQVAFAGERYRESYARLQAARALWLPSIRAGASYNKHEGTLQGSNGVVTDVSRSALNTGLGVQSIGAGSPMVPGIFASFQLRDAMFQPRIADHRALATLEASRTVTNDLLLDTALAYLDLVRAKQLAAIADETLANAESLAKVTAEFAQAGEGLQSDADRAQTELALRRNDRHRANEAIDMAMARVAELLSIDPHIQIEILEPTVTPIELVGVESEIGELVAIGLSNRPELAEARQLVAEAVHRYEREKFAPLLPSVLLGVSYSGFGGAQGGNIDDFGDRFDLDGVAYWELRNLGFGERAAREETRARYKQEQLREVMLMDRVAREIIQTHAQVRSRKAQIVEAERGVESAMSSYERNVARIRDAQGLPIEALQSLQALDAARREYLRVVADYNEAQFRLHRALGWPIQ